MNQCLRRGLRAGGGLVAVLVAAVAAASSPPLAAGTQNAAGAGSIGASVAPPVMTVAITGSVAVGAVPGPGKEGALGAVGRRGTAAAAPAPAIPKTKEGTMTTNHPPSHTNRLSKERSPYLQQHAHNPVDWYPWGPEAFERARREDKPIFLSIGYSTCHWCHVMERESFEDEEIAKVLNELFVCIKVDREERPDIDQIYMTSVMRLTGSGGWPLTVFLTPDLRPFYGGTYFPPEDRMGRHGIVSVARAVAEAWRTKREQILSSAGSLAEALAPDILPAQGGSPGAEALGAAEGQIAKMFDPVNGGFGGAPKFPRSHLLSFLLRSYKRTGDPATLDRVEKTLIAMAKGGMHDQLGGGFHRYSVDERWLVPHFEKMLYDQAILARSYLEAYRVTGNGAYAAVARDIFEYVLRDLLSPEGGFYSAEDADSEGVEGKFYVWTPAELGAALDAEDAALVAKTYGVTEEGNFEHGWSILHFDPSAPLPPAETAARLAKAREVLLSVRSKRIRPHRDEKVLADWNGLMIGALAEGGATLDEPRYAKAAARAADFVLTAMRRDGRLLHAWRDGEARIPAFLDDHAFLAGGLLDLYEATFDPRWLKEAIALAGDMNRLFSDEKAGGWFLTGTDGEKLLSRPKELYDGAVMSGNSMAALVLLRLGHLTANETLMDVGRAALAAFGSEIRARAIAYPQLLIALDYAIGPRKEVVIVGDPADPRTRALLHEVRRRFLPSAAVTLRPMDGAQGGIFALIPYLKEQGPLSKGPTAYVCENYACKLPVTEPAKLASLL